MPDYKHFDRFARPGYVSVWIGDFRSEDEFDDYLLDNFPSEFGFEIRPQAVREMGVEQEPVPISRLVRGFSRSTTFDSKVVDAAIAIGVSEAACMFIIYNFKYDGTPNLNGKTQIQFVGSIPYVGFT